MKTKTAPSNLRGFTLIELLIVIAILGTLASLVVLRFRGAQATALDTKRQAELKQYQNALEIYATRRETYPASINAAANTICTTLGLAAGTCPSDPKLASGWRNYTYQSNASGLNYVLFAQLERTSEFFVLCSNGRNGLMPSTWGASTAGVCPL
jgi:prepilin-type N-terminal cleavage/methylation domain-containing protein